ncbi:MAG: VanZ family protein [Bacteroidota bacterium]|jgi:VanZ family protein
MKLLFNNKLLPFIWTVCVFYLLSFDTSSASDSALWKFPGIDKLIHFVIFLLFAYLWGVFFMQHSTFEERNIIFIIIILGSGFGMGMEFYQKFFTNRSFSYWDGVADAVGTIAGVWLAKKSPYGHRGRNQN